jgi:AraC-like DNA-binding protein
MVKTSDLLFFSEDPVLTIDEKLEPLVILIRQEVESGSSSDSIRYLYYYLYDKFVERYKLPSLQYIHDNYAGDISVAQLAAIENYNVSYYTDWFKRKVGCLPSEYLKMVRIDRAKEILATTKYRIVDIALQVGYCSSSSFTRAFKAAEGISPLQYRKQASAEAKGK